MSNELPSNFTKIVFNTYGACTFLENGEDIIIRGEYEMTANVVDETLVIETSCQASETSYISHVASGCGFVNPKGSVAIGKVTGGIGVSHGDFIGAKFYGAQGQFFGPVNIQGKTVTVGTKKQKTESKSYTNKKWVITGKPKVKSVIAKTSAHLEFMCDIFDPNCSFSASESGQIELSTPAEFELLTLSASASGQISLGGSVAKTIMAMASASGQISNLDILERGMLTASASAMITGRAKSSADINKNISASAMIRISKY